MSLQIEGRAEMHRVVNSSLGHRHSCFLKCLYRTWCGQSMICALAVCTFTCVHLPTQTAGALPPTLLSKKQVKKVERLTTQQKFMTSERSELRDYLIFITEGAWTMRIHSFKLHGDFLGSTGLPSSYS